MFALCKSLRQHLCCTVMANGTGVRGQCNGIVCRVKSHIGSFGRFKVGVHMLIALNTRDRVGNVQKSQRLKQMRCGRKRGVMTMRNGNGQ
jgi:hypothetical protein